ncbi:MAG: HipA domain-containing protein [Acholeplasmatales bacterium]|nr:HipA domain-containing protein [Acholeplasmatales bacterium]
MVKFKINLENGLLNNHISEHLGSNIFNLIGIPAQITMLGKYNNRPVVLCKDFNQDNEVFVPFNGVGESSLERDKELYQYTYDDITRILQENSKITNVDETINIFWDMYIIDAFIGNFDRHGTNWGFLKKNNTYCFAPIFDNGSSLFPRRNNDKLLNERFENEERLQEITFKYPTSQIRINKSKSSYYEVINSLQFKDCNEALKRIYKKIDLNKINSFINSQELLTKLQKKFYIKILEYRYNMIIKASYLKLEGKFNE